MHQSAGQKSIFLRPKLVAKSRKLECIAVVLAKRLGFHSMVKCRAVGKIMPKAWARPETPGPDQTRRVTR